MSYSTLISIQELAGNLRRSDWVVVDCRFSLDDPSRGRRDYAAGHIPGAVYAHLDEDLSGPVNPGRTGRHPLPDVESFAQRLSRVGVSNSAQVVAYDYSGGMIAARLWWMLRWLGHDAAAVLDGGWQAWIGDDLPVADGVEVPEPGDFNPRVRPELIVETEEVVSRMEDSAWLIVDCRSPERFRGEIEPIDPVAGRIPGAVNAPHADTGGPDGRFLDPDTLRLNFENLMGSRSSGQTIFYCGSGVSAARSLLAMAHAGRLVPRSAASRSPVCTPGPGANGSQTRPDRLQRAAHRSDRRPPNIRAPWYGFRRWRSRCAFFNSRCNFPGFFG